MAILWYSAFPKDPPFPFLSFFFFFVYLRILYATTLGFAFLPLFFLFDVICIWVLIILFFRISQFWLGQSGVKQLLPVSWAQCALHAPSGKPGLFSSSIAPMGQGARFLCRGWLPGQVSYVLYFRFSCFCTLDYFPVKIYPSLESICNVYSVLEVCELVIFSTFIHYFKLPILKNGMGGFEREKLR